MGVDLNTYRCRVGSFVSRLSAGVGQQAGDGRGATVRQAAPKGQDADGMLSFVSFSKLIQLIRSLTFIGMWLILALIVSNLVPPVVEMGIDIESYRCRIGTFVGNHGAGVMAMCMPFFFDFSVVIKLIGTVSFVRLLLIMAGIEQNPGPVDKFFVRYQYLLVKLGTEVLRKIFDGEAGNNVVQYLNAKKQDIQSLKVLTADQRLLLQPINSQPDSSEFDITLLCCLLRNICGLCKPNDPDWTKPTGTSIAADITRLRMCRNQLMHNNKLVLLEVDFKSKWQELSEILLRLNNVGGIAQLQSDINNAEILEIDAQLREQLDKTLQDWHESDKLLGERIDEVVSEVGNVKQDLVGVVSEVTCTFHVILQILLRLNNVGGIAQLQSDINNAEILEIDAQLREQLDKTLQDWHESDKLLGERIDEVVSEVGNVKQDLVGVVSEVTNVKQDLVGVKRKLEDVELSQEEIKRQKQVDHTDLRNRLVKIYKEECCTLSVSPLCDEDEDEVEILSIYEPPSLYHVPYHRTQEKEEKYSISSYKEIFCKDDRTFRKIYITGDAGVGKTSFCKRMTFLWCKSQCGESVSDASVQNEIDFMAKFDFVFFVSLRDTHRKDVVTMIIEQSFCNENDLKKKEIYECVENILINHRCIIIMDALDEWTPAESGKININKLLSDKCSFVTTCRPYKIENERLSPRDLDRQVEITGIKESSIERYVTELLKHINMANVDNKGPNDFIRDVNKCGLQGQLCIPIITSHLVAVWYDHILTDMSRALIYSYIVDMLLKRAEQRKGIEQPSSVESKIQFPDSLSELFYFKNHISFLKKICLLSFNLLFKQDKCLSELVFTTEQLQSEPYCISANEMDFLCKFGILSKSKVIGRFGKREKKLSYLHKTYQEYFAALFVSSFDLDNVFDNIVQKMRTINDVVQFENFFIFFVGLSFHKSKILFENMYHTISDDLSLRRKNAIFHNSLDYNNKQIKSLQSMVINCFKEVRGSNDSFMLEDFIFDDYDDFSSSSDDDSSISSDDDDDIGIYDVHNDHVDVNSSVDHLKQILLLNTTCVKSIHSVYSKYYDEFDQIKNLQCLCVGDALSSDYVYDVKFTHCMLQNQSTLRTVGIKGVTLIPELPLRSLQHLTTLSLSWVTMQHYSLQNLVTFLSGNVLIENIELSSVSKYDNYWLVHDSACSLPLNLPYHTKLTSLCLQDVNISCNHVNNSSLKSIKLNPLSDSIVSCYIDVFNCIKYSQLEHLYIDGSSMLKNNTMNTLADTVNTLPCIKSLTLQRMKLPDGVLLQLHPDVTQVEIELEWVTLSRQCFHCFIDSCVNIKSVIKVMLHRCSITSVDGETHRVMSEEESLKESVDYMSEWLTSIPTVNITNKGDCRVDFDTGCCQ